MSCHFCDRGRHTIQVTFEEGCVIEPVSCILRALKVAGRINVTDIMDEKLGRAEEAEG